MSAALTAALLLSQPSCDSFKRPSCTLEPNPIDCASVDIAPLRLTLTSGGELLVLIKDRRFLEELAIDGALRAQLSQSQRAPIELLSQLEAMAEHKAQIRVAAPPERLRGLAAGPAKLTLFTGTRQLSTDILLDSPLFDLSIIETIGHPHVVGVRDSLGVPSLFMLRDASDPRTPRQLLRYPFLSAEKRLGDPESLLPRLSLGTTATVLRSFVAVYQPDPVIPKMKLLGVRAADGTEQFVFQRDDSLGLVAADPNSEWLVIATQSGLIEVALHQPSPSGPIFWSMPPIVDPQRPTVVDLAVGDLNGDQRADLVAVDQNNEAYVFRGVQDSPDSLEFDEGLSRALTMRMPSPASRLRQAMAIGDIDRDGRPDITLASRQTFDWTLLVIPYLGGNRFAEGYPVALKAPSYGEVRGLHMADLNGDSVSDVVLTTNMGTETAVLVYLNKTFSEMSPNPGS